MPVSNLHSRFDQLTAQLSDLKQELSHSSSESAFVSGALDVAAQLDGALDALFGVRQELAMVDRFVRIAGVVLLALDNDGCITSINEQGAAILGYNVDELVGKSWFKTCVPPESVALVQNVFKRLIERGDEPVEYFENDVLTKQRDRRTISWHNTPWKDHAGRIIGTLSSGEDVTEQRRIEAQLRAVVNTAVDAIITIDERGTIASFNPAAERMFKYKASDVIGKNVKMLMPSPYRDHHDDYLSNYLKTGERKIIGIGREAIGRRKDGSVFPIDLAVSEVQTDDTHLFTGIVRDITERKQLEREVLEISTEEQQRIGRDLHDGLGQELTGIAFLTDVFKKELAAAGRPEATNAAEIVKLVNQAIDHTRALVRGLCPVNLDEDGFMIALQQLAETVERLHGVPCKFKFDEPIFIDDYNVSTNLYYIAHEAANNAVRHGDPKRIVIEVHTNGRHAMLQIKDDGVGLPPSKSLGNGRGIQIMNYRARVIGGTLDVRPNQPQGTIVSCTFNPIGQLFAGKA